MKILHAYKDFFPPIAGGIERHLANLCRFQSSEHEVEALVCSRRFRSSTREVGSVIVREAGEIGRFQGAPISPNYPFRMRATTADLVVVHSPNPTAELSAILLGRRPYIVRYQSDVVRQATAMRWYGPFFDRFLRRSRRIIVASKTYLDSSDYLRPHADKCVVIPLGIVPEEYELQDATKVDELRERYDGTFVFFCGRHVYYKGLETLIDAAKEIQARVVIGGSGPLTESLELRASQTNSPVTFTGPLSSDELRAHLNACSVVAFPSVARSEAFGIGILEAHVCGKPVVATTIGTGVEEVNLHEKTGLNVPPGDPDSLSAAINELLRDPERAMAYGEFASQRVRTDFDARTIAERELTIYEQVIRE